MMRNPFPSIRTKLVSRCGLPVQWTVSASVSLSAGDQMLKYGSHVTSGTAGGRRVALDCVEAGVAMADARAAMAMHALSNAGEGKYFGFFMNQRFDAAKAGHCQLESSRHDGERAKAEARSNHDQAQGSMIASWTGFTVQLYSGCGWLSLFQRRRHVSLFGSMTSFRFAASAWPSANMMQVRRLCRLEGHSRGLVGSILPSNEPSGLLSPTMI